MKKIIYIKITKIGNKFDTFDIYDQFNNLIAGDVDSQTLIDGIGYTVDSSVLYIKLVSKGACAYEKIREIGESLADEFFMQETEIVETGCIWEHLNNSGIYNAYYGAIHPYIIEYPFFTSPHDDILQSFKDYSNVFTYVGNAKFSTANHIESDNIYFNKLIAYNNQQCSGLLKLVPKPRRNLKEYMKYPIYNSDSRSILFTKSDNFYQVNGIYDILKDKNIQMFLPFQGSLSIDKVLNQENMIYTPRSFSKALLRAKDSKVRLILDDRSNVHIISRFVYTENQISYK